MAGEIEIKATLLIAPETVRELLLQAAKGTPFIPTTQPDSADDLVMEDKPEPSRGRGKKTSTRRSPEPEKEPEPIHFKIRSADSAEDQAKSVIIQATIHQHGDAVARQVMLTWTDEDTAAITTLKKIFPSVSLEAIGKAVIDAKEEDLSGAPRLWLTKIFGDANKLTAEKAEPAPPAGDACAICGGVYTHKAGCPNGIHEEGDGGAIPTRIAEPEKPVGPEPEPCTLGGPPECPLPHHYILQGGTHLAVHAPEVLAKIRALNAAPAQPAERWNAPSPPDATPTTRKKGGWPRGKPRGKRKAKT